MEAEFEKAESYEDLMSGLFCTNCFHLIEDHFKFQSTNEVKCYASESADGFFKACKCDKISTELKMTLTIEDFINLEDENNVSNIVQPTTNSVSFGGTTFNLTK